MCRLYCKRVGSCTERDSNITELDLDLESLITELDLDLESLMEGGRVHHRGCSLSPESREVSPSMLDAPLRTKCNFSDNKYTPPNTKFTLPIILEFS